MPTVDRNGVNIHYEVAGDGPVVLLSHGYSATAQMWTGQVEALKDRYKVVTWDMRGHGLSDSPADQAEYSEDATVEDMAAILDAVGAETAVIGGLSLGGYMSAAFYLKHHQRTRALMLFDTGPGYRNPTAREGWNETARKRAEVFEEKGLDALGRSAEVRVSTHRSAQGLANAARGMLAQFNSNVVEILDKIAVPTMVLVGSEDAPFLGASEYMAKKIPNATYIIIEGAGHAANIDQPARFNEAVEAFLGNLDNEQA